MTNPTFNITLQSLGGKEKEETPSCPLFTIHLYFNASHK